MPQIPEFTATTQAPLAPPGGNPRATISPEALAAPGRALERTGNVGATIGAAQEKLGKSVEGLGEALGNLQQFRDYQYVADNWSDATTKWHDELQTRSTAAQQSGQYQGFAQGLRGDLDADLQQRLDNAPSSMAASRLKKHYATLTDQINGRAAVFEHGMAVDDAKAGVLKDIDTAATRNLRDPSLLFDDIGAVKARIAGAAAAGLFNAEDRYKLEKAAGNSLGAAHLIARAEADPIGVINDLKTGKYDDIIDAKTQEALQPRLQRSIAKGVAARLPVSAGGGQVGGSGDNWEVQHNNFGGLRIPGVTAGPNAGGFQSFDTPEAGVQAISSQLERYYQGKTTGKPITTLRGIVSTWAPPNENDTAALIARAAQVTGLDPDQQLTLDAPTRAKLIEATIRNEQGGRLPVDPQVIAKVAGAAPPAKSADQQQQGGGGLAGLYARIDKLGLDPEVAQMVKNQKRVEYDALETDQLRQQRQADQAAKAQMRQAEDAIIADAFSGNPQITAQQVANDPRFAADPERRLKMIQVIRGAGEAGPAAGPSHTEALSLLDRMRRPDGDPLKLTEDAPIYDALIGNKISKADFDFVRKEFDQQRTPDGQIFGKRKAEFLKGIEPQIDKSLFTGVPDVTGKERFYEFQWQLDQKIDEYRKAGKNPSDLLDPSKPDYLGKPDALKPYRRTLEQTMQDLHAAGGTATAVANAPDLTTREGIVAAYKGGKISRDQASQALIAGGFAAPAAAPTTPQPAPPVR